MQNAPAKEMVMSQSSPQIPPIALMRIPQILKVMPVSKSKFWLMVQKGEFPKPIKIGRSSFWTIEQVQAFIRERSGQSTNWNMDISWAYAIYPTEKSGDDYACSAFIQTT